MKKIFVIFGVCVLLTGCSLTTPIKRSTVANYTLTNVSQLKLHKKPSNLTLLISQPTASPGYQTSDMIYAEQPYRLQSFAVNRWIASPAQMLMPLLVQSLKNSGYFKAVVAAPVAVVADYQLNTHLLEFKQNFAKDPSQVIIRIQADLINSKTHLIISSHIFVTTINAAANTPYAGVIAANQSTGDLMQAITRFVVGQVKADRS